MTNTLKFTETDSDLIEKVSTCIYDVNGSNWYYMPYWFKKVGDGLYQQFTFDQLPEELKQRLNEIKETKTETQY